MSAGIPLRSFDDAEKRRESSFPKTQSFLLNLLRQYGVEDWAARGLLNFAFKRATFADSDIEIKNSLSENLVILLKSQTSLFIKDPDTREKFKSHLDKLVHKDIRPSAAPAPRRFQRQTTGLRPVQSSPTSEPATEPKKIAIAIGGENDIVIARYQARQIAAAAGFSKTDQIKVATAVSELARNIYSYVGKGQIVIEQISSPKAGIFIKATDDGAGIGNLEEILSGDYKSRTGMGLGILSCKRLMDDFNIESTPGAGTAITIRKFVP